MKNFTKSLVIILATYMLYSCQNLSNMKINFDQDQIKPLEETENIKFIKSWKRWDRTEMLRLYDYKLKKTENINGIPCKLTFTLDSLGVLYRFILDENFELNGTMLPAGSRYEASLNGNSERSGYMIYLSKPCTIKGYNVRNKAGLEDYKVSFYNDGSLSGFKTYENTEIDGIPCKGGKKYGISLYPNGKLMCCYLSKDFEIDGKQFKEGAHIIFDINGKVYTYSDDIIIKIKKELGLW